MFGPPTCTVTHGGITWVLAQQPTTTSPQEAPEMNTTHYGTGTDYHGNKTEHYSTQIDGNNYHVRRAGGTQGLYYVIHEFNEYGEKASVHPGGELGLQITHQVEKDRRAALADYGDRTTNY